MLKFTNPEKTSAEFNGAFFTLSSPENWNSIGDSPTREAVLAWLASGNTPELWETVEQARVRLKEEIKSERDKRKLYGVKVVVNGVDKWFHSDDPSRIQQLGLVLLGANIPSGLQWKTLDQTFVTMTPTLAQQIFAAVAKYDTDLFATAEFHIASMMNRTNPDGYDYSGNWPASYADIAGV